MKCIVIYSSSTGNTKAVANYIASKTDGKAIDAKKAKAEDLDGFDAVILGTRVHAAGLSKDVEAFARNNRDRIAGMKNAFYLCCMFDGEKGDEQLKASSEKLGIAKGAYFIKGKKLALTGEKIDDFIASI